MKSFAFLGLFVLICATGCGSSIEDRLNCQDACERYQDCVDSDYDVDGCVDRCTDQAAENDDYARQVDLCATCIDDRSCGEAVFACVTECAGIVP